MGRVIGRGKKFRDARRSDLSAEKMNPAPDTLNKLNLESQTSGRSEPEWRIQHRGLQRFFSRFPCVSWAIQTGQRKFLFFRSQVVNFTSFSWTKTAKLRNNARR
jgi:hypothetical protein